MESSALSLSSYAKALAFHLFHLSFYTDGSTSIAETVAVFALTLVGFTFVLASIA